ncbi:hypothetical protein D3872_00870 [Massilia cavernae]|uniref:Uncharacterized protein n=1 Tax=Massilia cavernae TaxID=2320864 RepID=A0A418Y8A0_9BURK|nr:hypothetical protein D3872_00870 [Massilia cavernae]
MFLNEARLKLFDAGSTRSIGHHLLGHEEAKLRQLLSPGLYRRTSLECALERLAPELACHLDSPNAIGSFHFWNRTRREIALVPYGLLGKVPTVFAPYLDHDLYDFLVGLPAEMLLDHTFHSDAIARAYPGYAHLPFEDKTSAAPNALNLHAHFGRKVAWRLLSRPSSRMIRMRFAMPRSIFSLVSRRFSASTQWYTPLALYLDQLDGLGRT